MDHEGDLMTENKKVDFKLTREGLVKIENKDTKGEAEVLPESLPVWLDNGWSLAGQASEDRATVVVVDEDKRTGTVTPVAPEKK
jgi:hypothetical protein